MDGEKSLSLLLEEKVSPVRTLVTDVVLLQCNFAEMQTETNAVQHTTSVKIGFEEPILTASPQGEAF